MKVRNAALTSKSNQFIFVANCPGVVNSVKVPQVVVVCKISCSQIFSIQPWTHGCMESLKTECLRQLFTGEGIKLNIQTPTFFNQHKYVKHHSQKICPITPHKNPDNIHRIACINNTAGA